MSAFAAVSSVVFLLASAGLARASEQLRPAHALESGKVAFDVSGVQTKEKDLQFHLRGANLIQVPLQGGGTAQFFASGDTDLKFEGRGQAAVLRLTWRPSDGLHYTFKAGRGDYEIRVPSGSVTNRLETASPGTLWGVEAGWTLVHDTPVTPAVAVSLGYTRADYDMTRLQSGGSAPVAVDQLFSLDEWQAGLAVSRRWKRLEPTAGVRFLRQTSTLFDHATAERVRGTRDGVSPFAGLRWEFLPGEAVAIEAAGADEVLLAAGVSIGF